MPCRAIGVILTRLLRSGHDMGVPDVPMASSVTCRPAALLAQGHRGSLSSRQLEQILECLELGLPSIKLL